MSLIKIKNTGLILMLLIMIHGSELALHAQVDGYRTPEQVGKWIGSLKSTHTGKVSSTVIATSPGKTRNPDRDRE